MLSETLKFSDLKDESVILKRLSLLIDLFFLFQPRIPGIRGRGVSIQKEITALFYLFALIDVRCDVVNVTYYAVAVLQF